MVLQATRSLYNGDVIFVGYTATKKIGNAVIRTKSKRRLRAIVREILKDNALSNVDYVFIARKSTADCCFSELKRDVLYALKRINKEILNEGNSNDTKNKNSNYNAT